MSIVQVKADGSSQALGVYRYQQNIDEQGEVLSGEFVQISAGEPVLYLAEIAQLDDIAQTQVVPVLNADSDTDVVAQTLTRAQTLVFEVSDFRDGRVFSLIRHARHLGFGGQILVQGEFALDQANYFVKSGADAFLVEETVVATLQKTLKDLASAYNGNVISRLPLFS